LSVQDLLSERIKLMPLRDECLLALCSSLAIGFEHTGSLKCRRLFEVHYAHGMREARETQAHGFGVDGVVAQRIRADEKTG